MSPLTAPPVWAFDCAVTSILIRIMSTLINITEKLFFKASTLKLMDFFGPFSSLIEFIFSQILLQLFQSRPLFHHEDLVYQSVFFLFLFLKLTHDSICHCSFSFLDHSFDQAQVSRVIFSKSTSR